MLFGKSPPKNNYFGGGNVCEVTEDGCGAPHEKALEKAMPM